jgi:hypothetical protein
LQGLKTSRQQCGWPWRSSHFQFAAKRRCEPFAPSDQTDTSHPSLCQAPPKRCAHPFLKYCTESAQADFLPPPDF